MRVLFCCLVSLLFAFTLLFCPDVSADPEINWHTFLGSGNKDESYSVATDASGNVYVTGYSYEVWGSPINAYAGRDDAFVAKLDTNGGRQWHTFLGSGGTDWGRSVTADANGNLYVTGYSNAAWGSPLAPYAGGNDAFVAKLDTNGGLQWLTFLGSQYNDYGYFIEADATGNLYVTGCSNVTWGSPVNGHSGGNDAFVAKLDTNGGLLWLTFLGSGSYDEGYSVTADDTGNLYVTGASVTSWGRPINAHAGGGYDAFVAKLHDSGGLQWNTFLGSGGTDYGFSIAVDTTGNPYVVGFSNTAWGSPINDHAGGPEAFVSKLNPGGVLQWHTFLGSSNFDSGYSVAPDGVGNIYVSGYSSASWGSPIIAYTSGSEAFVAKLDSGGILQWHTFLGTSRAHRGKSVALGASGNIYLTGDSTGTWGSPINAHAGGADPYVAKIHDSDIDDDGCTNDVDGCPYDLYKCDPGICGCGEADTDSDSDGTADCNDSCPDDPNKTNPGICGCGAADTDSDGDGTLNCNDDCPADPNKTGPGTCGCGIVDTDTDGDGDGTLDCNDNCPNDFNKTEPGICGCSVVDSNIDSDGDGTFDCNDSCLDDPDKTKLGICGCGTADTDSDNDGTPNCNDNCPDDPDKITPGTCSCGTSDKDSDSDGTPDCNDDCPADPNKIGPGACGCNNSDTDTDTDGKADCIDPDDDGDGVEDNADAFPSDAGEMADNDQDGTGDNADNDDDNDGVDDSIEIAGPGNGDGNADGIADCLQNHVTTLEIQDSQQFCTLALTSGHRFTQIQALNTPPADDTPEHVTFDYGYFDFTAAGIGADQSTTVTLYLPAGESPTTYYKYGKTPDNPTDHWYEFLYDGQTGAEINGNVITLHFVDGQRGDDILTQDGNIIDVGGPGFESTAETNTSGSGGGCFISSLRR